MKTELLIADYTDPEQARDIVELLDEYACDPMGGGQALSDFSKSHLIENLQSIEGAFSVLCYQENIAIGLINCFQGFSTFQCKPLINIHDVYVKDDYRGQKISHKMLKKVEEVAVERQCCKLTLEVLEGNDPAKKSYRQFGFAEYQLHEDAGKAGFWEKML